jgi:hypothetical protein
MGVGSDTVRMSRSIFVICGNAYLTHGLATRVVPGSQLGVGEPLKRPVILKTALPSGSFLERALPRVDYADAYRGEIRAAGPLGIGELFPAFVRATPAWISFLMRLRNRLVGGFGLKTGTARDSRNRGSSRLEKGESRGLFEVLGKSDRELMAGKDDKHLDFRVSALLEPLRVTGPVPGSAPYAYSLTVSTIVMFRNRPGKIYFALVKPFHKLIVPAMLRSLIRDLAEGSSAERAAGAGKINPTRVP